MSSPLSPTRKREHSEAFSGADEPRLAPRLRVDAAPKNVKIGGAGLNLETKEETRAQRIARRLREKREANKAVSRVLTFRPMPVALAPGQPKKTSQDSDKSLSLELISSQKTEQDNALTLPLPPHPPGTASELPSASLRPKSDELSPPKPSLPASPPLGESPSNNSITPTNASSTSVPSISTLPTATSERAAAPPRTAPTPANNDPPPP